MTKKFLPLLAAAFLFSLPGFAFADQNSEVLYARLVQPILNAKCTNCHGEEKQKGKLRLDSLEEVLKGSDGENVIPGKVEDSLMTLRITLPKDDDEVMPPEDEPQLTKEEIEVIKFWVQSGARGDAKIGDLKPSGAAAEAIKLVLAHPPKGAAEEKPAEKPKEIDPARLKIAQETIGQVEKTGASLMAIAQDTPQLRFSALNVAKDFGDENLKMLKPVAGEILWMDLARTQVTDAGLSQLEDMKNLTRLHLENTRIGDAGLDHLKGLANLEYLNLYGAQVTDAGIQKLAGLKNLKKIYLWQSKVTEEGAKKLAAQIPGLDVNTGWKEPTTVAAVTPAKKEEPAKPAAPAQPEPTKPEPKKEEPKKPESPKPAPPAPAPKKEEPAKPEPAKPAPTKPEEAKPEVGSLAAFGATIDRLLAEAKRVSAEANQSSAQAGRTVDEVKKVAAESTKSAAEAKQIADEARTTAAAAKKTADEASSAAEAARKSAEAAQYAAMEARKASEEARKIAGEARAALEKLRQAAVALAGKDAKGAK